MPEHNILICPLKLAHKSTKMRDVYIKIKFRNHECSGRNCSLLNEMSCQLSQFLHDAHNVFLNTPAAESMRKNVSDFCN